MRKQKIVQKKTTYPITSFILLGVLGMVSVFVAIEIATSGAKLSTLEMEEKRLMRENEALNGELVRVSSLSDLVLSASDKGFAKPVSILYITEEKDVAALQ